MIIKNFEENIEIIHISKALYDYYQKLEHRLQTCESYLEEAREDKNEFKKALQEIYSYSGNESDALKLQEIADKILWKVDMF